MFSVFLLSYRNTRESLGELEKAVTSVSTAFLILPNLHSCCYMYEILTVQFLIINWVKIEGI